MQAGDWDASCERTNENFKEIKVAIWKHKIWGGKINNEDVASLVMERLGRKVSCEPSIFFFLSVFVLVSCFCSLFHQKWTVFRRLVPRAVCAKVDSLSTLFKVGLRRRWSESPRPPPQSSERLCRGTNNVTKQCQVSSQSFSALDGHEGREDLSLFVSCAGIYLLFRRPGQL